MRVVILAIAVMVAALVACGNDDQPEDRTETQSRTAPQPRRGVATIAAELAPLCVDRLTSADQGAPASPEIARLVDELIAAYIGGPKNESTTERMRVALDNMENGCGPDQARKIAGALEATGETPPPGDPSAEAGDAGASAVIEPDPDGEYDVDCDYLLGSGDNYRFVAGGDLENTGNIGIVVQVVVTWDRLGSPPARVEKRYRVRTNATREVQVSVPATLDDIDAHQSADADCDVRVRIVDTFGNAEG
jgi:hypothetical protein